MSCQEEKKKERLQPLISLSFFLIWFSINFSVPAETILHYLVLARANSSKRIHPHSASVPVFLLFTLLLRLTFISSAASFCHFLLVFLVVHVSLLIGIS